jgi:F0F1-type ATP synthase assembly protein I
MTSIPPESDDKAGLLLQTHRKTVESTQGMSPAVLMGSSFALAMGGFAWLGMKWDAKHHSEPWGVLFGVCMGFVYGGYEVWKVTRSGPTPSGSGKRDEEDPQGPSKG